VYLASLKNRGSKSTSKSGTLTVYVIDILIADSFINSWVFDTGSVAHICNSMQELTRSRSMARGEVDFRVGNKQEEKLISVWAKWQEEKLISVWAIMQELLRSASG
jgi:hypothetical protein